MLYLYIYKSKNKVNYKIISLYNKFLQLLQLNNIVGMDFSNLRDLRETEINMCYCKMSGYNYFHNKSF